MTGTGMGGDQSRITRRQFVKSSAMLVGGASFLAACGGGSESTSRADAGVEF